MLRGIPQAAKLTLAEVAETVGLPESSVQRYEKGIYLNPTRELIIRFSEALAIPLIDLMGWNRIADELQQLLDEQKQLRASLAEQNVDPDLIDRIRYCVDTVIKAGEEQRQKESIRAQLKIHQSMRKPYTKDDSLIERKEASQLL